MFRGYVKLPKGISPSICLFFISSCCLWNLSKKQVASVFVDQFSDKTMSNQFKSTIKEGVMSYILDVHFFWKKELVQPGKPMAKMFLLNTLQPKSKAVNLSSQHSKVAARMSSTKHHDWEVLTCPSSSTLGKIMKTKQKSAVLSLHGFKELFFGQLFFQLLSRF